MEWETIIQKNIGDNLQQIDESRRELGTIKELIEGLIGEIENNISTMPENPINPNHVKLNLTHIKEELQAVLQKLN